MGWAQLPATDDTPSSSWGHTTTWLGGSSLLLFGGELLTPGPLGSLRADDSAGGARLLRMELTASAEQRWARVPSAEAPEPPPRRQHAAAVWGGQLVVTGGLGGGGTGVGDLWSMVPTADGRARWATSGLEAAWSPVLARHGHTLVPTPSGLLLFGGRMAPVRPGGAEDGAELKVLNDLWLLRPVAAAAPVSAAELTAAGGTRPRWRLTKLEADSEVGCDTSWGDRLDETAALAASDAAASTALKPEAPPLIAFGGGVGGAVGGAATGSAPCGRAFFAAHWYSNSNSHAVGAAARGGGGINAVCGEGGCMLVHGGLTQGGRPRGDLWAYGVLPSEARRGAAGAEEEEEEEEEPHVAAGMPEGRVEPGVEGQERPWEQGGGGAAWRGAAWRLVRPAPGSDAPPPRAAHASALWGKGLFVYGGEGQAVGSYHPRGGRLWRFDLVSLRWTALLPGGTGGAGGAGSAATTLPPRVLSAASLLAYAPASASASASAPASAPASAFASASAPASASASQQRAAGAAGVEGEGGVPEGGVLLLLGGTEGGSHTAATATRTATGGEGGAAAVAARRMTVWRLSLRDVDLALRDGGGCWPGCKFAEVCDLEAEVCICEAGATCGPPPLQLRTSDYAAAGRGVAQAWAVVGVSVVGALLGAAAQRGGALLLKRHRYRHVPDATGTTWPGS